MYHEWGLFISKTFHGISQEVSQEIGSPRNGLMTGEQTLALFGSRYSRMDEVKLVEGSF